jgi:hydrogenase/urease accessory protein HupE
VTARRSLLTIWRWPVLFAALSVVGLLSALLGQEGLWLPLSWIALAAPLVAAGVCIHRRSAPSASPRLRGEGRGEGEPPQGR